MEQRDNQKRFADSLDAYSRDFYHKLFILSVDTDLICSPLSTQICAAMLRMGAKDDSETSRQLDAGLKFDSNDVNKIADDFHNALKYFQQYSVLRMANKVYIMNNIHLRRGYCDALTQKFFSTPEQIDFKNAQNAAITVNGWVESQTNSLIKDLVSPDSFSSDTRLVLINAIYFKGQWDIKFDEQNTESEDFFVDDKNKVKVSMMNSFDNYFYADLAKLNAKALQMAYKDTKLYMLIILPNKIEGLVELEKGLKSTPLKSIVSQLQKLEVSVKLPKFKTEFSVELTTVFRSQGMEKIFRDAEFDKMLEMKQALKVSQIVHKAFIEVNEEGTEAAAATAATMVFLSMGPQPKTFHADHPFYYIIYDEVYGCLFMGNLKNKACQFQNIMMVFCAYQDNRGVCEVIMAEEDDKKQFTNSLDSFSRDLYHKLVGLSDNKDLICSPLSIQVCAGMLRMGATDDSETSHQLDAGLKFSSHDVNKIADNFHNALEYYQKYSVLRMANRVYIMDSFNLLQDFSDALTQKFLSTPEQIDFKNAQNAATTINGWVESQTNNLIKELVSPDSFSSDTRLVLINAIYFKGQWGTKFDEKKTKSEDFFVDDKKKIQVSMMNSTNDYDYAELSKLDAKALRLSYKDTELFMLIILPNKKDGLANLEKSLKSITLESITSQLDSKKVSVKLPKFKTEFSMELTPVFKALGMVKIFNNPEFDKMLSESEPLKVSQIVHKAFIEVNEEGTEAAAATSVMVTMRSMPMPQIRETFTADHPFCYIIYDEVYGCLFMGNLKNKDPNSANVPELCAPCKSACPRLQAKE